MRQFWILCPTAFAVAFHPVFIFLFFLLLQSSPAYLRLDDPWLLEWHQLLRWIQLVKMAHFKLVHPPASERVSAGEDGSFSISTSSWIAASKEFQQEKMAHFEFEDPLFSWVAASERVSAGEDCWLCIRGSSSACRLHHLLHRIQQNQNSVDTKCLC